LLLTLLKKAKRNIQMASTQRMRNIRVPGFIEKQKELIIARFKKIKHKILIGSGKGGVGKSFVAANLAVALAMLGKKVGILDADFHGPDIPKILGLRGAPLLAGPRGIEPVISEDGVKVVSLDFMLPDDETPVIWRGPLKITAIRQLLGEVNWGELDYFIVDLPPGTGDEPLSIAQEMPNPSGIILVTLPSEVSLLDVKRAAGFARKLNLPILGVIENMSYYKCPKCGHIEYIFGKGGGEFLAKSLNVDLLGQIPLSPRIAEANDKGEPYVKKYHQDEGAKEILKIAEKIVKKLEKS